MNLHFRTLMITSTTLNIILTAYLVILNINHKERVPGILYFVFGMVLITLRSFWLSLQSDIRMFYAVIIINTAIIAGLSLFNISFYRLFDVRIRKTGVIFLILIPVLSGITQYIFAFPFPILSIRIICISAAIIILFLNMVIILIRFRKQAAHPGVLLIFSFLLVVVTYIIQIPIIMMAPVTGAYLDAGVFSSFTSLIWVIASGTFPIGFSLLISYKLKLREMEQNREKAVLLQELHHRTRNNMQVISSMLTLQRSFTSSQEVKDRFLNTQNTIETMALVHKKLQESNRYSYIDLREFIEELVDLILSNSVPTGHDIQSSLDIEQRTLIMDVAIPLSIIICELISNSLRHAFPCSRGKIALQITQDNKTFRIHYEDNGRGFPEDFNFNNIQTLGLITIMTIVEQQLSGCIQFNKGPDFRCDIEFEDTLYSERI